MSDNKKPLEIDMNCGSQVRDIQGEILDIAGADISELEAGRGLLNDNHSSTFANIIGRVTYAKKIFKEEECEDERQRYYWDKVKAPYIYARGELFSNDQHSNANATAAILRNIHRSDIPIKIKASVEGGVVARGDSDPSLLLRTKISKIALTFSPANTATLVEPLNLDKSAINYERDQVLIQSVLHLIKTDIPTFKQISRTVSAAHIINSVNKAKELAKTLNIDIDFPEVTEKELIKEALMERISDNINKINSLVKNETHLSKNLSEITSLLKALTAGYGGGSPTDATGGQVMQSESIDYGKGFKYITCHDCGKEQIFMKNQVKCRECNKSFSFSQLAPFMSSSK